MSVGDPVVLVVDDELEIRRFLALNLEARGFRVLTAQDGTEGLKLFGERPVDLAILDVSIPGPNGFQVCERIRASSQVPIIMLSASAREADKVRALDLGADDYITKPFGVPELMARVGAALRRVGNDPSAEHASYDLGGVRIDLVTRSVTRNGETMGLTSTEYNLLSLLLRNEGRVLTHRYLLDAVWGPACADDREYLRAYMYRLRRKIEPDPRNPAHIRNIPGVGYSLSLDGAVGAAI